MKQYANILHELKRSWHAARYGPSGIEAQLTGLRWELRLSFGMAFCMIAFLGACWVVSSFLTFIQPAPAIAARVQFGSATSYCTFWATDHEQIGKPTPGPCGVMLVGVNLSPSPAVTNKPYTNDAYDYGNCTYWAALRRGQVGMAIPNTWGDAYMWAERAAADGYTVDHRPAQGAIMQTSGGSLGHVAYVESVDQDGTWHISEMNVIGFNEVDERVMPPSAAATYYFIH